MTAAADEADGGGGASYKSFGPAVTTLDGLDGGGAAMQETPVTSVILPRRRRPAGRGGRDVARGERHRVRARARHHPRRRPADGERTWTAAELGEGADQPLSKAGRASTADVPLPPPKEGGGPNVDAELVCRAVTPVQ